LISDRKLDKRTPTVFIIPSDGLYEKTFIGLPDDPPTKALFEFVEEALKK